MFVMCCFSIGGAFLDFLNSGLTTSVSAAAALSLLASLEYVNYFHVQLQHFDNRADFQRLGTRRRFRRSHLAKDIARWRELTRFPNAN